MKTGTKHTSDVHGAKGCDKAEGGDTETRLLVPIRVLYTINESPQFLLARQKRKVQVVPIARRAESTAKASTSGPADRTIGCHKFAKVPLKVCLGAVCKSSPELLADRCRDYSVYVLDPLESASTESNHATSNSESLPSDSRTSDTTPSSYLIREGVSIGMGLMSWCIADDRVAVPGVGDDDDDDDDDGCAIGKLVVDRGAEALEVVIFLRETALQSQQQHALSLSSLGFYPSSTASPTDYPPLGNAQHPLSIPSSPKADTLLESSQSSINGVDRHEECVSEFLETSPPEAAASSTSGHVSRVGRPPGSLTNPEKRARRLAIQSHKETLERMENIAKMQQGREYDKTLIRISDHDIPAVTKEEIARQRKILQDLESRPLIVDKSRLLTTKPLPKRAKTSTSIVPLSRNTLPKRTPRSASATTNAPASGSRLNTNDIDNKKNSSNVPTINAVESKHGTQLLLSLLTSVLGKVDGSSADSVTSQKGKEKESTDGALAGILKELLPFIPNAVQANAVSASRATPSPASTFLARPGNQWGDFRTQGTLPLSKSPALFKTAAETFYDSRSGPNGQYDQHWAVAAKEQPKVHENAHPVPGGGWARGRNLIPRAATSTSTSIPLLPSEQIECSSSDPVKCASTSTAQAQPDKENTPPTKTGRGLKRALSTVGEAGGKGSNVNDKKRKQNTAPAVGTNEVGGAKRTTIGLTARDKTNTSVASDVLAVASSPSRSTALTRTAQSLPVMAMSEPDYLSRPPPIVASSTFPELIKEAPRTPPRHETDDNAGDSLFTPCAPDNEFPSLFRVSNHHSVSGPLSSPSAARGKSLSSHVANVISVQGGSQDGSGTGSESRPVKTGWDLPPSSPPPPTSPISPHAGIDSEQDDNMDLMTTLYLQTPPVEMEKGSRDGNFEDQDTTIKSDGISTPAAETFQIPECSSDFDLFTDNDFDIGSLRQAQEGTGGIELDIEELWGSLGPVIAQAQSGIPETSSQVDADLSYFDLGDNHTHVAPDGGVDATKLAEDLKALFGGCVV